MTPSDYTCPDAIIDRIDQALRITNSWVNKLIQAVLTKNFCVFICGKNNVQALLTVIKAESTAYGKLSPCRAKS
jgi:hypothetical protein